MKSRHLRVGPGINLLLILPLTFLISACGSSGDDNPIGSASDLFASSEAVNERFGNLLQRDLSPQPDSADFQAVVMALNDFSLKLHRTVATGSSTTATIESGYSAAMALSLASAGTDGATQTQLSSLLGFDAIDEQARHRALNAIALGLEQRANEGLVLRTANRLFVKPSLPLQSDFMDMATGQYGAPITEADFAGAGDEVTRLVNDWVTLQTDSFIPSIIDRFEPSTVFALLNAIFLDARWQDTYEALDEYTFTLADTQTITVPAFTGRSPLALSVSNELTALEIPYFGEELAMLILMPESLEALEALESSLDAGMLDEIIAGMTGSDVRFSVPDWEASAELDLYTLLQPLGLPANPWHFGRMINGGLALEILAKQKARIEVDKDGTRAAAVTLIAGDVSEPRNIRIDKPFLYVLRDRTSGVFLFTGRVIDPR